MVNTITKVYNSWVAKMSSDELDNKFEVRDVYDEYNCRYWFSKKRIRRDNWLNFEFFLATELGKTLQELRKLITEEELVYWAAYYEVKNEREKQEINRQKAKTR